MQPLKITAHLAGSIAIARPEDISLDGILAYEVLRRHFGDAFYTLPDPKETLYFAAVPLEMRGQPSPRTIHLPTGAVWMDIPKGFLDTSLWYWACSSAQVQVKGRDTQHWNKRFDVQPALSDHIDFGGRVEKVIIEQGRFKAYHMPMSLTVAEQVVWYAYGDQERIAELLKPITAISKKRSQGQGYVTCWQVELMAEDYSEWKGDTLMRPIPGPLVRGMTPLDMQYIAFRAPQWHTANQCMCATKAVKDG